MALAALAGNDGCVRQLLAKGADPAKADAVGQTVRDLAGRHPAIRRLLVEGPARATPAARLETKADRPGAGARVETKADRPGIGTGVERKDLPPARRLDEGREAKAPGAAAPLSRWDRAFLAAVEGNRLHDAVKALVQGARLQAAGAHGRTGLMLAAQHNHEKVLDYLLGGLDREDIDRQDDLGRTALAIAALAGSEGCVQRLLAKGADPAKADAVGQNAYDLAGRHPAIQRRIEAWQAASRD